MGQTQTWHHGLVARWWGEFNHGGEDIAWFQSVIEHYGEPALDAGCGTGRLLVPYLRAGLDVDGSDASADMLTWCEKAAKSEGLAPNLYPQAMHELDLPRTYRTIVNCGAFGLGGGREEDLEGLRRIHRHLEPGGAFAFDHYLPNFDERAWLAWLPEHRPEMPRRWPTKADRREAADGTVLELRSRRVAFDPLGQSYTAELRVDHLNGDELIAREEYSLTGQIYLQPELLLMLKVAGFSDVRVTAGFENRAPRPWEDGYLTFVALRS